MIKSLSIQNFQSHKDSHLEFDPGVNVIIGSSDSGKTAVLRALRWLVWNRPTGDAFRSTWGGETSVRIECGGFPITRSKDKDSCYSLGDTLFKAFGTEIPEEIKNALNLSEINLQQQLDSPFLLTSSPGEVAQHFNRVANLEKIDSGLRNVQKWIRELEQEIVREDSALLTLREQLKKYDHLGRFEVEVEVLEGMQTKLISDVNRKRRLEGLVENLQVVQIEIKKTEELLKPEKELDQILAWIKDKEVIKGDRLELNNLIWEIEENEDKIQSYTKVITVEGDVGTLLKQYETRRGILKERKQLQKLIEDIIYNQECQKVTGVKRQRLQKEFDEMMPNVCPLCNQKIEKF